MTYMVEKVLKTNNYSSIDIPVYRDCLSKYLLVCLSICQITIYFVVQNIFNLSLKTSSVGPFHILFNSTETEWSLFSPTSYGHSQWLVLQKKWVSCMYTHKPDAIKADFVMVALHLVEPVLVGIGVEEVRKCSVTWPHLEWKCCNDKQDVWSPNTSNKTQLHSEIYMQSRLVMAGLNCFNSAKPHKTKWILFL